LTLYVLSNLFVLTGNLSLNSFLTGIGATKQMMKQGLLSLSLSLPIAFVFIPYFGSTNQFLAIVMGAIGILFSIIPGMIWGIYWTWKNYKLKINFSDSLRILASSSVAAALAFVTISSFVAADWIILIIGFTTFLACYLLVIPLVGVIKEDDITNLRVFFSGLGVAAKLLRLPLGLMHKVLHLKTLLISKK
ncbi:MAG TPA: hypothetical protein VK253_01790, partial [Candidatus Binatia bacterium]|nr:hypothetical protein [Candidatus Binatia bacterium]